MRKTNNSDTVLGDSILTVQETTFPIETKTPATKAQQKSGDIILDVQTFVAEKLQHVGFLGSIRHKIQAYHIATLVKKVDVAIERAEKIYPQWFLDKSVGVTIQRHQTQKLHSDEELAMLQILPELYKKYIERYNDVLREFEELDSVYVATKKYIELEEAELNDSKLDLKIQLAEFETEGLQVDFIKIYPLFNLVPPLKDGGPDYGGLRKRLREIQYIISQLRQLYHTWETRLERFDTHKKDFLNIANRYEGVAKEYYGIFQKIPYDIRRIEKLYEESIRQFQISNIEKNPVGIGNAINSLMAVAKILKSQEDSLLKKIDWHTKTRTELGLFANSLSSMENYTPDNPRSIDSENQTVLIKDALDGANTLLQITTINFLQGDFDEVDENLGKIRELIKKIRGKISF